MHNFCSFVDKLALRLPKFNPPAAFMGVGAQIYVLRFR